MKKKKKRTSKRDIKIKIPVLKGQSASGLARSLKRLLGKRLKSISVIRPKKKRR